VPNLKLQEMQDERILASLADNPLNRQEAIVQFILGCAQMALDLKEMCRFRRYPSYSESTLLEETAASVEQKIAEEFRRNFGHELFNSKDRREP
jgi:hypothetical protein